MEKVEEPKEVEESEDSGIEKVEKGKRKGAKGPPMTPENATASAVLENFWMKLRRSFLVHLSQQ